jgi:hypothetical protein
MDSCGTELIPVLQEVDEKRREKKKKINAIWLLMMQHEQIIQSISICLRLNANSTNSRIYCKESIFTV